MVAVDNSVNGFIYCAIIMGTHSNALTHYVRRYVAAFPL